ncbi:MAG: DNA repair protein RadA [Clostridiales bacterium]|nr:DNA repair protein RadA [Clostridiales bacterium]
MAKKNISFFCSDCGFETTGWSGKCPSCGAWNTMTESTKVTGSGKTTNKTIPVHSANQFSWTNTSSTVKLSEAEKETHVRSSSGISSIDNILGGGITLGGVTLIGGEPGIGKSTLLLQIAGHFPKDKGEVFYISGEESADQIALRADRLDIEKEGITVCSLTCFERIAEELEKIRPSLCIIDSVQTLYSENITGTPGSVSQAREVTAGLVRIAKTNNIPIFLVGHITKDGTIAGPKTLEHMVDTVLYFEGEDLGAYRILRSIKNRFGKSGELAFFEMTGKGLLPVDDLQSVLISGHPMDVPGSSISAAIEGTKAIAIEIQALMTPSGYTNAQRMCTGIEKNRTNMLLAVADKFLKLNTPSFDAFINVVGGLKVSDPALDLAILAAIVSSVRNIPIRKNTMVFGEVGLTGELRSISMLPQRLACASKSGISTVILPSSCKNVVEKYHMSKKENFVLKNINKTTSVCDKIVSVDCIYADNLSEAIDVLFS